MKTIRTALVSVGASVMAAGVLIGSAFASAGQTQPQPGQPQPDSVVAVVAGAQGLPFVPADQRPLCGTYWEVRSSVPCMTVPLPVPPLDPNTPVYAVGGGQFLSDETAGQLISPQAHYNRRALNNGAPAAILQAQVDELQGFVAQIQAAQFSAPSRLNGQMSALDADIPPVPGGGSGTNDSQGGVTFNGRTPGTNDLWLEARSRSVTNSTTALVIHPPWGVTNGVYDLYSTTNLVPAWWNWVLRCAPGQTNLTLTNRTAPIEFFILGLTNDTDGGGMSDA